MGAITVRKLDEAVIEKIKERARIAGRSMEEEVRTVLTESTQRLSPTEWVERMRRRRKELFGDRVFPDSTPLIREMRNEDPTVSPPDAYK